MDPGFAVKAPRSTSTWPARPASATVPSHAIRVFTTRADTLPGVTYVVLAPEHPLVSQLVTPDRAAAVQAYVDAAKSKNDLDRAEAKAKTGVPLGAKAKNPVNGEEVPIWVADYVIATAAQAP